MIVGLVLGDPAGVGAELAAKVLSSVDTANVTVIGDARQLEAGARIAGIPVPKVRIVDTANADPAAIALGKVSAAGGRAALQNFTRGLDMARAGEVDSARAGEVDSLCFTPFNKQALHLAGNRHEDELRYAADYLGFRGQVGEFNVLEKFWNARVTSHIPLKEVAAQLSVERIVDAIALTHESLKGAGFAQPRIAVAALNPHAGEGGSFGREEIDVIAPAVAAAQKRGIGASGPFPADTVYIGARDGRFDAVVSMFHDQGQIAFKLIGFSDGVTLLGGLPIPITTPAHGTAYDIAGRGVARDGAMRNAFKLAAAMGSRRRQL
jgi:4-hydroxythreonine-4-phosphate dehydrogenase